jgi:hypothetical protein
MGLEGRVLGLREPAHGEEVQARAARRQAEQEMSLYDFQKAFLLYRSDEPFYSLIMAAMLKSDDINKAKLQAAWPEVWEELDARYHSRGGRLPGDDDGGEIRVKE